MSLIQRIRGHHDDLLQALEQIEALAESSAPIPILTPRLDALRHRILAHELTVERLVVGPLRRLRLLDGQELDELRDELCRLNGQADELLREHPDAEAVTALVGAIRGHLERMVGALASAASSALAEGGLSETPGWYVEDVYEVLGGPVAHATEEWLG